MDTLTLCQVIYVIMTSSLFLRPCRGRPLPAVTPGGGSSRRRGDVTNDHVTFRPSSFARDDVTRLTSIVESFDQLGFLLANNCYELEYVERTTTSRGEEPNIDPAAYVTVSLRLRTITTPTSQLASSTDVAVVTCTRTMTSSSVTMTTSAQPPKQQAVTRRQLLQSLIAVNSTTSTMPSNASMNNNNETSILYNSALSSKRKGNFGSTQVLVMGLCSGIIGVFFVAVITLRIRNYCRRVLYKPKEERQYRRPGQHKRSPVTKTPSNRPAAYPVSRHPLL